MQIYYYFCSNFSKTVDASKSTNNSSTGTLGMVLIIYLYSVPVVHMPKAHEAQLQNCAI